ncbi:MAG: hypothetical protein ACM3Y9_04615 [Ignavibacteria bacterium]
MAATPVRVLQIFYSEETRRQIDPGFEPLDNAANPRPDWREYWPIRNFLLSEPLEEDSYYGFFSPKFAAKTRLAAREVFEFAAQQGGPDVISFSPYYDQIAVFLNMFEQGEAHHAGLVAAAQQFLDGIGFEVRVADLPQHSGDSIYCNYFLAKPGFWREWLRVNEALFALCEANATPLAAALNAMAQHDGSASCPLKVFVMERVASLLLSCRGYTSVAFQPMSLPRTTSLAARLGDELVAMDAFKMAFAHTGRTEFLSAFQSTRQDAIRRLTQGQA